MGRLVTEVIFTVFAAVPLLLLMPVVLLVIRLSPADVPHGRDLVQDLLGVEDPELLWANAVPEDAGEPQRHADLHSAEDDVVGVATRKINPAK